MFNIVGVPFALLIIGVFILYFFKNRKNKSTNKEIIYRKLVFKDGKNYKVFESLDSNTLGKEKRGLYNSVLSNLDKYLRDNFNFLLFEYGWDLEEEVRDYTLLKKNFSRRFNLSDKVILELHVYFE